MTMQPWLVPPGQQGPGLGEQFAKKAAGKLAADQVAKLGLQAAGTSIGGPLGGAAATAATELAGPLASQLVGSLFNKGGAVYKQGGGQATYDWLYSINPAAAAKYLQAITDTSGELVGKPANAGEIVIPKEEKLKAQAKAEKVMPEVVAPRAKSRATWDVPLGDALGASWSTQGHYADMDQGKDPWGAMIKGTWKFDKGGEVSKKKGWWDKAKSAVSNAASHAWKNDNLEKPAGRWKNVQYKNIGGMTPGPLGMSDLLVAGKGKDISKVKLKKAKGDMSEEVEYNYHPPLAAKPKPTGE